MEMIDWTLPGSSGETIFGNTHLPDGGGNEVKGALLICHGYKGYKDYGFFPALAQAAAQVGWAALRFNFSHSGMTNNIETFERADLFEQDTWSKQIFDLQAVASAAQNSQLTGGVNLSDRPIVWFGHSRGGLTTLLTAARAFEDKTGKLIKPSGVIAAASPDKPCNLSSEDKKTFHLTGRMPVQSSRTGQMLYVGLDWLEEIENDPKAFDPVRAVKKIGCPLIFIHGTDDQAVSVQASEKLNKAAKNLGQLEIIANAAHTFNCPNPLPLEADVPPETVKMIEESLKFADGCLK